MFYCEEAEDHKRHTAPTGYCPGNGDLSVTFHMLGVLCKCHDGLWHSSSSGLLNSKDSLLLWSDPMQAGEV